MAAVSLEIFFTHVYEYESESLRVVDISFTIFLIQVYLALYISIFVTYFAKGWSNLTSILKNRRSKYPEEHNLLMHKSFGDVFARRNFTALEKKYDKIDERFNELNQVFGTQGIELLPEATSFERSLTHMALVWVRPLLLSFVVVLIPVDYTYFKIIGMMVLHQTYYLLLYLVRAVSRRDMCYYILEFEFFSTLNLL